MIDARYYAFWQLAVGLIMLLGGVVVGLLVAILREMRK